MGSGENVQAYQQLFMFHANLLGRWYLIVKAGAEYPGVELVPFRNIQKRFPIEGDVDFLLKMYNSMFVRDGQETPGRILGGMREADDDIRHNKLTSGITRILAQAQGL